MWQGVRTYVDGVVEDHILHELGRINPNLEPRQRKRLREMAKRASHLATGGDGQQALIQLRSCLMLSMRGIQDPEILASVQSLVSFLPYSRFEEPIPRPAETLSIPEIDEVLKDRGVNCSQVSGLSIERRRALMQSPPILCPISWENLSDATTGKLLPGVVAIFEEDRPRLNPSASFLLLSPKARTVAAPSSAVDGESAVWVVEQSSEDSNTDLYNADDGPITSNNDLGTFRFATSVFDAALQSSMNAIETALSGARRLSSNVFSNVQEKADQNELTTSGLPLKALSERNLPSVSGELVSDGEEGPRKLRMKLPESVLANPRVSIEQKSESSGRVGRKGWTITPARGKRPTIDMGIIPRASTSIMPETAMSGETKEQLQGTIEREPSKQRPQILIRCHLFKGSAVRTWFDLGHVSNPVTRATVLIEDWCRLTDEQQEERGDNIEDQMQENNDQ